MLQGRTVLLTGVNALIGSSPLTSFRIKARNSPGPAKQVVCAQKLPPHRDRHNCVACAA